MKIGHKHRLKLFLLITCFLLAILTSPFWVWTIMPNQKLDILIIDKTVENNVYREHKGLVWLLNHEKVKKENGKTYAENKDFLKEIPDLSKKKQSELPDFLYVADTYGVEYANKKGKPAVDGGLTDKEVQNLQAVLMRGKTNLIAEFNTFASPTEKKARDGIAELLNVAWSGWMGRYFQDMDGEEVPVWLKENYKEQYKKSWSFKGKGMLFVHENGDIVVLQNKDMKKNPVMFSFHPNAKKAFDLEAEAPYQYWFDIIKPINEEGVLADYHLNVTQTGEERLKKHAIPTEFPAIIHYENAKYQSYYFAGDFADQGELPAIYQTWGFSTLKKWMVDNGSGSSFYWKVYVPLMKKIVNDDPKSSRLKEPVEVIEEGSFKTNSRTHGDYIQIRKNSKWENILIKGVNMGIAKPGAFPGETAISKEEYYRWFKRIGEMNANAIRVYTIHPPGFYEALYEYNQIAEKPLFLFHGVWVNEDELVKEQDVYSPIVTQNFKKEMKDVVDIINGNASIPKIAGHSGGVYKYDLSKYLLGYMLGVEWDPEVVKYTNEKHPNMQDYKGTYFASSSAAPFENWLAEMMDYTTEYETKTYHWQHAITHVNWLTTDLLKHPSEPYEKEDMVTVNPNLIKPQPSFHAGYFASYHIYPYYPDFLSYEKKYLDYKDHRGEKNNYAGYLNDLRRVHDMPVIVAEFGVPSSRGITHKSAYGFNQGYHTEKEQGEMDTHLFEDIVKEKYAGGLIFTWQDEWFKKTWNTLDFDNGDRRPYWSNAQTNEQQFGLLSFDPSSADIKVDGKKEDWNGVSPYQKAAATNKDLKALYMNSDVRYLYMRIDYKHSISKEHLNTSILLDTIKDQGNFNSPNTLAQADTGIDFSVELNGEKNSRILVDSYYDTFYYLYGERDKLIERKEYANKKNNGIYHPIRLVLNKELTIPDTKTKIPFQSIETGKLNIGNGDPSQTTYNSLTDISVNEKEGIVELRIPWLILNMKDPSLHEMQDDVWKKKGLGGSVKSDGIAAAVLTFKNGSEGKERLQDTLPSSKNQSEISLKEEKRYLWNEWDEPQYKERLKQSYYIIQKTYKNTEVKGE